jgi:O-antigen/teichoic acid export membrane protein
MNILRRELQRIGDSSLARNAGWMVLGQGGGFFLQAAYFVLIARLLGPVEYGIFAGALALTSIIGQYSTMGSGTLFLRYVSADPEKFSLYWGNILLVTTLGGILVIAALSLLPARLLSAGSQSILVLVALSNCFCTQLTASAAKVFQTYELLRISAALNLAANFLRTLAAAAMLLAIHRASAYQWAVATVVVSLLVTVGAVITVTAKFGRPRFSLIHTRANLLEGFGFSFATSTSTAYNDLDKTLLSHYGMNAANGIYTMAYRIIDVAAIPVLSIREAALPRFFRSGATGVRGSAAVAVKLLKRAIPLGLVASVAVFVTAPLVPHLVGNGFRETVSALRWLCLIPLFRSFHQMTASAITGSGAQKYVTASQLAAVALNVGLNVWLIPRHGWLGAAWSSLATDGSLAVMNCSVLTVLYSAASRAAKNSA